MNIGKIEENIQSLLQPAPKAEFIYDLLLAYGLPKASVTRLKDGSYNLSKNNGGRLFDGGQEILWKKKLFFREVLDQDLHVAINLMCHDENALKHGPRFVIVTDYVTLLAYDTKTKDTLDTSLKDFAKRFDFFLPWAGREKAHNKPENPADVKAAEKMAKLYDLIRQDNPHQYHDRESLHELNVFLSRLLFCYFAEDTEIFPKKMFVNSIQSHTQDDGSDLAEYLNRLFEVLNTCHNDRKGLPEYLTIFEYVNGGLFGKQSKAPKFSNRSRKMLVECGELNWSEINPDIFGSMIQAVVHPDQRGGMGMHYTSVSNIMKVIEPLFLNELHEEFENYQHSPHKLDKLLGRLSTLRIFDPACGSGNFLIIAYKELRLLEIKILKQLKSLSEAVRGLDDVQASLIPKAQMSLAAAYEPSFLSRISLSQFYGIELDDFAHEIAVLSLWLAEHQMNVKFNEVFRKKLPSLPLKQGGKVICGNAVLSSWESICPITGDEETYILGNPPYQGARKQNKSQKADIEEVFSATSSYKNLDYIACWFKKGAEYIAKSKAQLAFVSTNSICQGEQVSLIWPDILNLGLEIGFAYQAFKWSNNAKKNAGVTCVIVNLRTRSNNTKSIYADGKKQLVSNINPYLAAGKNIVIFKRKKPLSNLPRISFGNMANDGGHLFLNRHERDVLLSASPLAAKFVRKVVGSDEFINGLERWCLWIRDDQLQEAQQYPFIRERIAATREKRLKSPDKGTQKLAESPYRFRDTHETKHSSIIVPSASSEHREYIPIGIIDHNVIVNNLAHVVYEGEAYVFGLLASKLHNIWVRAVGGQLETRIRYSAEICYNNFPVPNLSPKQKETITTHALNVLEERENYPEKTLADLYDPEKMPKELRIAHDGLNQAVERCYRAKPFAGDEDRLEYLFKLYEGMTAQGNVEETCLI